MCGRLNERERSRLYDLSHAHAFSLSLLPLCFPHCQILWLALACLAFLLPPSLGFLCGRLGNQHARALGSTVHTETGESTNTYTHTYTNTYTYTRANFSSFPTQTPPPPKKKTKDRPRPRKTAAVFPQQHVVHWALSPRIYTCANMEMQAVHT